MDVTCFLTQHWNSRRQLRHPKPERLGAEIMDLPHSITFARVQGLQRRARASTTKSSDLRLADRALGHQVCHIQLTIELRKLVLVFLFQVRRCEQVQNSGSIPNLHPRILEHLRGCAVRDLHNLPWIE